MENKGKTIILNGISRNPYAFTVYEWGAQLLTINAVYAVLGWKQPGYSVLYIGSTSRLGVHLYEAERRRLFAGDGCTHIGMQPLLSLTKDVEPVVSRRLAKVTDLVASYAPLLNFKKQLMKQLIVNNE